MINSKEKYRTRTLTSSENPGIAFQSKKVPKQNDSFFVSFVCFDIVDVFDSVIERTIVEDCSESEGEDAVFLVIGFPSVELLLK
jgi:hypothetical protein